MKPEDFFLILSQPLFFYLFIMILSQKRELTLLYVLQVQHLVMPPASDTVYFLLTQPS